MAKILALAFSVFFVLQISEVSAQGNVYFTGVGRALVTNDELKDDTDPASRLKSSGGYTLFDLGVYAKPNEVLRGGVILRIRNEFGGFFGDGAFLQFRQLQMEGIIAKKVKYDIGDIYIKHTRYTLWNEDNSQHEYEANIFSLRRNIVYYENFFVGNNWRMQGVNLKSKINFTKAADSLLLRGYGGRTMQTNFTSVPDRYFFGARLDMHQSKYFRIGGNLAGISDIAGTVKDAEVDYDNIVYTTDFDVTLNKDDKYKFVLKGEVGASHFKLSRVADSSHNEFNDFFYDIGAEASYKPLGLSFGASYRDVGYNFNSPMAQTRRVVQPSDVTLGTFPVMNDGTTARPISLFDFYNQEYRLYNQAISTTLMSYFIQYDMVEPYGQATPNRKGVTLNADIKNPNKIYKASVEVDLLSEVVSEGDSLTQEKRKFKKVQAGFVFNVNQVIGFKKLIAINVGYRAESSVRGGTNPVDLSNSLIDLGLDIETFKSFHLIGGAKLFNVKGSEIQTRRNELNQIVVFGPGLNFNQKQTIVAAGLRYDYDNVAYFSMQYHKVNFNDRQIALDTYKLNQWFFVFGLKF